MGKKIGMTALSGSDATIVIGGTTSTAYQEILVICLKPK